MSGAFVEIKHRVRGADKVFEVQPVLRAPGFIVVRFVSDRPLKVDGHPIESGSVTLGYFWSDRTYNVYRVAGPGGALVAHRFDILRDVSIAEDRIEWTDLLVDAWVWPDGRVEWKDLEQLAKYRACGWIPEADVARVRRTRAALDAGFPRIVAEVERIASGIVPSLT